MKYLLFILILTIGCRPKGIRDQISDPKQAILQTLQDEYKDDDQYKEALLEKIEILRDLSDSSFVGTISFESKKSKLFLAQLFLVVEGQIVQKVERVNYKYHPGFFKVTDSLPGIKNEILYEILLPTSSIANAMVQHEYFEVKNNQVASLVDFTYREVTCLPKDEFGRLIERKIVSDSLGYSFKKRIYTFDCNDFDWWGNIEGITLFKEESERYDK